MSVKNQRKKLPEADIKKTFERHGFFVSRETLEKFVVYERLLLKWQQAINLVGASTLDNVAERHFFDSAQIFKYVTDVNVTLADMGSGAGFPGMVLAMLGVSDVHLIESDVRKATFLREVARETGTKVVIHDDRVEACKINNIDVFTARALAPLKDLLKLTSILATPGHGFYCLFSKGLQVQEEITQAQKKWSFEHESFPSQTDMSGKIVRISKLESR